MDCLNTLENNLAVRLKNGGFLHVLTLKDFFFGFWREDQDRIVFMVLQNFVGKLNIFLDRELSDFVFQTARIFIFEDQKIVMAGVFTPFRGLWWRDASLILILWLKGAEVSTHIIMINRILMTLLRMLKFILHFRVGWPFITLSNSLDISVWISILPLGSSGLFGQIICLFHKNSMVCEYRLR